MKNGLDRRGFIKSVGATAVLAGISRKEIGGRPIKRGPACFASSPRWKSRDGKVQAVLCRRTGLLLPDVF